MPTPLFVTASFDKMSGLPEDATMNSFAFIHPNDAPVTADFVDITNAIYDFYNKTYAPQAYPVSAQLSPSLARGGSDINLAYYDISPDSTPGMGSPIHEAAVALLAPPAGTFPLPAECAVTLSLTATATGVPEHAPGGARPKARYRGRIFIGPLCTTVSAQRGVTNEAMVDNNFALKLTLASQGMLTALTAKGIVWGIWSRTDAVVRAITGGWVDDTFDTIRSRGVEQTARSSFGTPQAMVLPSWSTVEAKSMRKMPKAS